MERPFQKRKERLEMPQSNDDHDILLDQVLGANECLHEQIDAAADADANLLMAMEDCLLVHVQEVGDRVYAA